MFSGMALEPNSPLAASQRTEYTCPMHPEVVQEGPGNCPICVRWRSMRCHRSANLQTLPPVAATGEDLKEEDALTKS